MATPKNSDFSVEEGRAYNFFGYSDIESWEVAWYIDKFKLLVIFYLGLFYHF